MVLFVFVAVGVMIAGGGYYFLNKPVAEIIKPLDLVREEVSLPPPTLNEENEEAIMDDVFVDSEVVQLYKNQDKYWRWASKKCAWSGPAIALVIQQEETLSPEDLQHLEKLDIPLTLAILSDQPSYDLASPWAKSHGDGLFLSLPPLESSAPKEMADQLESLLQGKKVLTGVLSSSDISSKETLEPLLLHLKHRGLVLIDGDKNGLGEEISEKILALYLKQDMFVDTAESLPKVEKNSKPLILTISLKKPLLSKIIPWIKQQKKKGISFVRVTDLFCKRQS